MQKMKTMLKDERTKLKFFPTNIIFPDKYVASCVALKIKKYQIDQNAYLPMRYNLSIMELLHHLLNYEENHFKSTSL